MGKSLIKFSEKLIDRLKVAYNVVVLTGAGMSAASGVPTFRGKDGLWNKFNPEELANINAFLRNPDLVWEWYSWRRNLIKNVNPNLGHYALVDMEQYFPEFAVITQNVDNLHQQAGSKSVIELHGNIMRNKCIDCGQYISEEDLLKLEEEAEKKVPHCPQCGGLIRPDVVWFGELLPQDAIEKARELSAAAEVFFSVGTSSQVEPAASLPYLAKGNGAYLVEINPEATPLSSVADECLREGVEKVLPALSMEIEKIRKRIK
ncbi:MAG: NAD-dependent deacylase [Calditrichaeota bacterium]|nr:MAG: NAD-dependent deacylase [Calditrichota bacterium]